MKHKFKDGQIIQVKTNIKPDEVMKGFVPNMRSYSGKIFTIFKSINNEKYYYLKSKNGKDTGYAWHEDWLEIPKKIIVKKLREFIK